MNFSVNLRSLLLLLAMVQGLVIAGLLLGRGFQRRQPQDFFLAGLLVALATSLITYFIGFLGVYDYAREQGWDLTFFPFNNPFWYGPLIWLYTQALTDRQFRWTRRDGRHFLLPLAYYGVCLSLCCLPLAVKDRLEKGFNLVEMVVLALSLGYYLLLAWRRLHAYRRLLPTEYSNTDRLALHWLYHFLYVFAGYYLVSLAFNLANLWTPLWYTGWYWLELTRAVMLYYLSVTGWAFAQKTVVLFEVLERREAGLLPPTPAGTEEKSTSAKPLFSAEELAVRREKLQAFMQAQRPWLDPDLTLSQLAGQTGLNVSQLSYLINAGFGINFNDFVNTYRVEAVKQKMSDPAAAHLSLLGVAFECGFNSKATFNRAFKKLTGVAPSQFLNP